MMRLTISLVFLAARLSLAQGVNAPVAGMVLDGANRLVPVHGVFGNLLRGESIALPSAFISASFSDTSGLLKSAAAFVITDGSGQEQSSIHAADSGAAIGVICIRWFAPVVLFGSLHNSANASRRDDFDDERRRNGGRARRYLWTEHLAADTIQQPIVVLFVEHGGPFGQ